MFDSLHVFWIYHSEQIIAILILALIVHNWKSPVISYLYSVFVTALAFFIVNGGFNLLVYKPAMVFYVQSFHLPAFTVDGFILVVTYLVAKGMIPAGRAMRQRTAE